MSHQKHEKNPRPSNTGVHSSKKPPQVFRRQGIEVAIEEGLNAVVSLDWLGFTVPSRVVDQAWKRARRDAEGHPLDGSPMAWVLARMLKLPCTSLEDRGRGHLGWTRSWGMDGMGSKKGGEGGARLAVGGQNGTARVSLSARALRFYQARGWDVWGWIDHMDKIGAKCTALDVAFDDIALDGEGWLSYYKFVDASTAENVVSRYGNKYEPQHMGPVNPELGWTLVYGVWRKGPTWVEIYDKAAQQRDGGKELPEDLHWVRVEPKFRGERGVKAFEAWKREGFSPSGAVSLLRGLLDFRERQEDEHNKDRWPMLDWWEGFLGDAQVVHLGTDSEDKGVIDFYEYLVKQAAPALALVNDFYGEEAIARLIAKGRERLDKRHLHAMDVSRAMGDVDLPA